MFAVGRAGERPYLGVTGIQREFEIMVVNEIREYV